MTIAFGVPIAGAVALRPVLRVFPSGTLALRAGLPATIAIKGIIVFSFFGADAHLPFALVELNGASLEAGGTVISFGALSWTLGTWMQTRFFPARAGNAIGMEVSSSLLASPVSRRAFYWARHWVGASRLGSSPDAAWA